MRYQNVTLPMTFGDPNHPNHPHFYVSGFRSYLWNGCNDRHFKFDVLIELLSISVLHITPK